MFGTGQQKVSNNDCRIMLQCLVVEAAKYNHDQHQRRKLGSPMPQMTEKDVESGTPNSNYSTESCGLTPAGAPFFSYNGCGDEVKSPLSPGGESRGMLDVEGSWYASSPSSRDANHTPSTMRDNAIFASLVAQQRQVDLATPIRHQEEQQEDEDEGQEEGHQQQQQQRPVHQTEEWQSLLAQVHHQYDTCAGPTPEDRFLRAKCKMTPLFMWNIDMGVEKDLQNDAQDTLESISERHRRRLSRIAPGKLFL